MSVRRLVPIALSGALALATSPALAQEAPAAPDPAPATTAAQQKDAPAASHTDWHMVGAIVSYSLAAVALGTYGYSYVRVRNVENDQGYQQYKNGPFTPAPPTDVCQAAKSGMVVQGAPSPGHIASLCSEAKTFQVVGIVSLVTAVAGIGTGTALLLTRPAPERAAAVPAPRLALTPVIGVHSAAAELDYRF